jgi:hypothetical protein
VHARVAAAVLHEPLERLLLRLVEHVSGGGQPDHGVEPVQVGVGERGGVLGRLDGEAVRRAEVGDRGDAVGDRVVPEARRLGEDEQVLAVGLRRRGGGDQRHRAKGCGEGERGG